jgi:hypothetical protein
MALCLPALLLLSYFKAIPPDVATQAGTLLVAAFMAALGFSGGMAKLAGPLAQVLGALVSPTATTETTVAESTGSTTTTLARKVIKAMPLPIILILLSGCTDMPVISPAAVQDISDAVCTELEANQQTDTVYVQFVCSIVDPTGKAPPKSFKVRMAKTSAAKAACVPTGKPAP